MRRILLSTVLAIAFVAPAIASEKGDSLRHCQGEWKAEKAKPGFVKAEKGKGRDAYWTFVRECRSTYKPAATGTEKGASLEDDQATFQVARGRRGGKRGA